MATDSANAELKAGDKVILEAEVMITHNDFVTLQLKGGAEADYKPTLTIHGRLVTRKDSSPPEAQAAKEKSVT